MHRCHPSRQESRGRLAMAQADLVEADIGRGIRSSSKVYSIPPPRYTIHLGSSVLWDISCPTLLGTPLCVPAPSLPPDMVILPTFRVRSTVHDTVGGTSVYAGSSSISPLISAWSLRTQASIWLQMMVESQSDQMMVLHRYSRGRPGNLG